MTASGRVRRATCGVAAVVLAFLPDGEAVAGPEIAPGEAAGLIFKSTDGTRAYGAPVLGSDVFMEIVGDVARVTVRQRFRNPSKRWFEGLYVFPLPERSVVDRLRMRIGDRFVEGRILEKAEAETVYRQAAEAGQRAALISSARPNVFSTAVANIGPGDEVVVEIEYQDTVPFREGRYRYRFPLVVAPRYSPVEDLPLVAVPSPIVKERGLLRQIAATGGRTVPKRDLFGPVRNPEDGPINPISIAVLLHGDLPTGAIESSSHAIETDISGDGWTVITLADGTVPTDRDFVLSWRPRAGKVPDVSVFAEERAGDTHLLVTVSPPAPEQWVTTEVPRDLILVLDKSGSMHGEALAQAKAAAGLAIARLQPADRFNLVTFDDRAARLFDVARGVEEGNVRRALAALRAVRADGGTEMGEALTLALAEEPPAGRLRQVVFLTDGAVSNEDRLFDLIRRRLGRSRLFTVGIGPAPNSFFMVRAAEAGRGSYTYIDRPSETAERVTALFEKLERPALTGLTIAWTAGPDVRAEVFPAALPDLYFGEPISFTVRLPGVALDRLAGEAVLTGDLGARRWSQGVSLAAVRPAAGIAALWARAKIADLRASLARRGGGPDSVRASLVETALRYRLVTEHTSLVAVDDRAPARPAAEALHDAEIARNLPHGMDYDLALGTVADPRDGLVSLPPAVLQDVTFRRSIALPATATRAGWMLLVGLTLILAALALVVVAAVRSRCQPARP